MNFSYELIETQIIEALPELKLAADVYAKLEGKPGEDSGAYIFFEDMFQCYVKVLLAMPGSARRDQLLERAFSLVEAMLESSDEDVRDLAFIGILEDMGSWFYANALQFLGPMSLKELDRQRPDWRELLNKEDVVEEDPELIDLYCVREVILLELSSEGVTRVQIPGITYPNESRRFSSLEEARHHKDAVIFLSCYETTDPYIVGPVEYAACNEQTLLALSQDLAEIENKEPDQRLKAQAIFFQIPLGERVWNMNHGDTKHMRYTGELWIDDIFVQKSFSKAIKEILDGKRKNLNE